MAAPVVTPATVAANAVRRAAVLRAAEKKEEVRTDLFWKSHLAAREGNPSLAADLRRRARAL